MNMYQTGQAILKIAGFLLVIVVIAGLVQNHYNKKRQAEFSAQQAAIQARHEADVKAEKQAELERQQLQLAHDAEDQQKKDDLLAATKRSFKDPQSVVFSNLIFKISDDGTEVCGMVNAKNSFGGYGGLEGFYATTYDEKGSVAVMLQSSEVFKDAWRTNATKLGCA